MKKVYIYASLIILVLIGAFFVLQNIKAKKEAVVINQKATQVVDKKFENLEDFTETENYFAPILAFHNVTDSTKKDKYGMTINTLVFEKKLKDLNDNKYKTIFASEAGAYLEKGKKFPKDEVALTFDDGKENFYTNIFPLLKKYNIKASLYIITGVRSKNYLSEEQIKEIDKSGLVEIGSHTVYHQLMTKLSDERQMKELKDSKKYLENLLGKEVSVICYPYGDHNEKTKAFAKQVGYKYGLNYNSVPLRDSYDMFEIDRVGVYPELFLSKYLEKLNLKR